MDILRAGSLLGDQFSPRFYWTFFVGVENKGVFSYFFSPDLIKGSVSFLPPIKALKFKPFAGEPDKNGLEN